MADPGFPVGGGAELLGGVDLQRGCFSAKTYAKMKELDPVGGARAGSVPPDPPMGYGRIIILLMIFQNLIIGKWDR